MNLSVTEERTAYPVYVVIITLPFLMFFWMVPFVTEIAIGQDYQTTWIQHQMEILFLIKTGSFPLYAPGFALGHSSSALTLSQVYHPISHIASFMPGYWEGKALQWNTVFKLLSLGMSHLAIFGFLRQLKLNSISAVLVSAVAVYNLRMLDLFRYGASLEAYTGYLLLCAAIGWYCVKPSKLLGPLSVIGSVYLLTTSGHIQMVYYGLLGGVLFAFVVPFFVPRMLYGKKADRKTVMQFWIRTFLFLMTGIMLSAAYIVPLYFDFVSSNVGRVGQSYEWADLMLDTFAGTVNSFFLPLRSDVHGAFGGSSLIIVAAIVPVLSCIRVRIPRVIWCIWGISVCLFLYMQGSRTPLHRWAWEYLPFASSFRTAGRISLILPVFLMLLLAWVLKAEPRSICLKRSSVEILPSAILSFTALLVMTGYLVMMLVLRFVSPSSSMLEFGPFTAVSIHNIPFPSWVEMVVLGTGMTSLLALAFFNARTGTPRILGVLLCLATAVQAGTSLRYGTWTAVNSETPTFEEMVSQKKETLDYRHNPGSGFYSAVVDSQVRNSFMEPFLAKVYYDIIPVADREDAYQTMRRGRAPGQLFVESFDPGENRALPAPANRDGSGLAELEYSSYNRLRFRVFSSNPAFLSLSYPFTGHWTAWVNDSEARVYRSNGASHAVQIGGGLSEVEFRYRSSAAFWGMILSCSAFILVGLCVTMSASGGLMRVAAVIGVLAMGAGGFTLWFSSLYNGDNLRTQYTWKHEGHPVANNIAYGKETWKTPPGDVLYLHSSRAVDGDQRPHTGFATRYGENASWTVDLYTEEEVKSIVLYESSDDPMVNRRPLRISVSTNGKEWSIAGSVVDPIDPLKPVRIIFETSRTARFIRIQAMGYSSLRLDEVEVYGPQQKSKV